MRTRNKHKYRKQEPAPPLQQIQSVPVEQKPETADVCPDCGGHLRKVGVAHFTLAQEYTITCDESAIDDASHMVTVQGRDGKVDEEATVRYNVERKARSHRMYTAIMGNKEALHAVLEYQVLTGADDDDLYCTENYGKTTDFYDILVSIAHCFTDEDRQWLEGMPDEGATRWIDTDDLRECFKVTPSGWCLHTHGIE